MNLSDLWEIRRIADGQGAITLPAEDLGAILADADRQGAWDHVVRPPLAYRPGIGWMPSPGRPGPVTYVWGIPLVDEATLEGAA